MHREINLCAEYLDRPMAEVCATMLHKMAHLYKLLHSIEDTSNNGYYHNKRFKDTAEAHGLIIEKHNKYSWTVTTLSGEAEAWLKDTLGDTTINASRLPEGTGPRAAAPNPRTGVSSMFARSAAPSSGPRGRTISYAGSVRYRSSGNKKL